MKHIRFPTTPCFLRGLGIKSLRWTSIFYVHRRVHRFAPKFKFQYLAFVWFKVTCKESLSTPMFSTSLLCFSILLIFCLTIYSSTNTSLLSLFLTCNSALSFYSFSKTSYKLWTNLFFSFLICLFLITTSESLSTILVICALYFVAYWNILAVFLCSSKFTSSLCIDPCAWC